MNCQHTSLPDSPPATALLVVLTMPSTISQTSRSWPSLLGNSASFPQFPPTNPFQPFARRILTSLNPRLLLFSARMKSSEVISKDFCIAEQSIGHLHSWCSALAILLFSSPNYISRTTPLQLLQGCISCC